MNITSNLSKNFHDLYYATGEVCAKICERAFLSKDKMVALTEIITGKAVALYHSVDSYEKISTYVCENQTNLFFAGCCTVTALIAPNLFFLSAVVTVVTRVEFSHYFRTLANTLKDEYNPYLQQPFYGPDYINSTEMTFAVIGTVDAIAFTVIFSSSSWTLFFLPMLSGIAAGSCLAKMGMDLSHKI